LPELLSLQPPPLSLPQTLPSSEPWQLFPTFDRSSSVLSNCHSQLLLSEQLSFSVDPWPIPWLMLCPVDTTATLVSELLMSSKN
jgi:hypothetical protein